MVQIFFRKLTVFQTREGWHSSTQDYTIYNFALFYMTDHRRACSIPHPSLQKKNLFDLKNLLGQYVAPCTSQYEFQRILDFLFLFTSQLLNTSVFKKISKRDKEITNWAPLSKMYLFNINMFYSIVIFTCLGRLLLLLTVAGQKKS